MQDHDPDRVVAPASQELGQTMAEYAVVLGVITLIIITALIGIGDAAGGIIDGVAGIIRSVS